MADAVVIGAGPVGLLLAAELALGGARVEVLERLEEPSTTIKAGSINLASAEILARRGLLDAARAASDRTMAAVSGAGGPDRPTAARLAARAGHIGGIWLPADAVREDDPAVAAHTAVLGATFVPQHEIEALLAEHARRLGVTVRRGVTVTGVETSADGVRVHTDAGEVTGDWVVGCDGGRSAVRHAMHVSFPGSDPEITGRQAVVDLVDDTGLNRGWNWSERGVYCYGPMPGRVLTVEFTGAPQDREAPVTAEEIQASLRRVTGSDVTVRSLRGAATRWTDNARQASSYRDGRLLLAGDAAHVHSPFSGQGLNLGLGDATNLGWKLAAVIRGDAPEGLLDTYTSERHPIGAWVLDWTRAQVALMRPEPKVGHLRQLVTDLLATPDGATWAALQISGVDRRLDLGSADPRIGRTVADMTLADGTDVRSTFTGGRFVLLDRHGVALTGWDDRLTVVDDPGTGDSMLIRPDGVVAWAGTDSQSLVDALERWAGPAPR